MICLVFLTSLVCTLEDLPDLATADDQAKMAGIERASREKETLEAGSALGSPSHKDLKEALSAWEDPTLHQHEQRANAAAKQAAELEVELARKAAGVADLEIEAIIAAVQADDGNQRKVLYSLLSEDYRQGGASAYNKSDYYIRHQGSRLAVTTFSGATDRQDATFKLIQALCPPGQNGCPDQNPSSSGCVTFESVNWQRSYLVQHEAGELTIAPGDGSDGFKAAATFCLKPAAASKDAISIEPLGKPEVYMLHDGYHIVAGSIAGATPKGTAASASFRIRPGLFMGFCQGPDNPTDCTCLPGYLGDSCAQPCPGLKATAAGATEVCSNRGDCALDDNNEAACVCIPGYLGAECNLQCPRSVKTGQWCNGKGECAVNEAFQPTCKCSDGFLGNDCSVVCPGAAGELGACSGNGQCVLDDNTGQAKCNCDDGFLGADCFLSCPRDQADSVCGNNGQCHAVGDADAKCTCKPGWVGKACDLECPSSDGAVCSGHGQCTVNDDKPRCVCQGGFLGAACQAGCPGLVTVDEQTVGCNGHGDCMYDAQVDAATCKCNTEDGWLGEGCQFECARGTDAQGNQNVVCSGHGTCELDHNTEPSCNCVAMWSGAGCGVSCHSKVAGEVCSGHGSCTAPSSDEIYGSCVCDEHWMGKECGDQCPKGPDGRVCSGHGTCKMKGQEVQCDCDPQWSGNIVCSEKKCGTEAGLFDATNDECKCPATSERCCSRDVFAKAALLDKFVSQHKRLSVQDFDSLHREVLALEA